VAVSTTRRRRTGGYAKRTGIQNSKETKIGGRVWQAVRKADINEHTTKPGKTAMNQSLFRNNNECIWLSHDFRGKKWRIALGG
jgi:hypothetical protein